MREMLFRGQRTDNNEWVYGSYHCCVGEGLMRHAEWKGQERVFEDRPQQFDRHWILVTNKPDTPGWTISDTFRAYSVKPETVGQLTGLKDKNGTPIYESDFVKYQHSKDSKEYIGEVTWRDDFASFWLKTSDDSGFALLGQQKIIEVLENIFTNPELIK